MKNKSTSLLIFFLLAVLISACSPRWKITLTSENQPSQIISQEDANFYIEKSTEEISAVPLGQLLYASGYTLIDTITLSLEDGATQSLDWDAIACDATLTSTGTVSISGADYTPNAIHVTPPALVETINFSIMDIAPTMAQALSLPELPNAVGVNRYDKTAEHGVMILLDGLQYQKLVKLIKTGKLPFFQQHQKEIRMGLTVYPPITTSASAALLTSAPPQVNGVYGYGYRSTASTTLFDLAADAGLTVKAVEGASLAFNLRNAETILSGDRDGDGFSDDNVFENSLDIIQSGMPRLMYIHFHNIDDMGHKFGPDSPEYTAALIRVDKYLANIYTNLPNNTLLVIFADHGMHPTEEGGNHGTLTAEDLIIPILFIRK